MGGGGVLACTTFLKYGGGGVVHVTCWGVGYSLYKIAQNVGRGWYSLYNTGEGVG